MWPLRSSSTKATTSAWTSGLWASWCLSSLLAGQRMWSPVLPVCSQALLDCSTDNHPPSSYHFNLPLLIYSNYCFLAWMEYCWKTPADLSQIKGSTEWSLCPFCLLHSAVLRSQGVTRWWRTLSSWKALRRWTSPRRSARDLRTSYASYAGTRSHIRAMKSSATKFLVLSSITHMDKRRQCPYSTWNLHEQCKHECPVFDQSERDCREKEARFLCAEAVISHPHPTLQAKSLRATGQPQKWNNWYQEAQVRRKWLILLLISVGRLAVQISTDWTLWMWARGLWPHN